MNTRLSLAIIGALALAGCANLPFGLGRDRAERPAAQPASPIPTGGARTADALDTTTEAERAAATAAPAAAGERQIGTAAVALGNPAEPGIWFRGGIVTAQGKGRVVTQTGQSVVVDLLPGQGAAQLSLAAFRALGLSLTALPQVTVFAN